jgi:hypothetical protein
MPDLDRNATCGVLETQHRNEVREVRKEARDGSIKKRILDSEQCSARVARAPSDVMIKMAKHREVLIKVLFRVSGPRDWGSIVASKRW